MVNKKFPMEHDKKIALVAHDNKKRDMLEWAKFNRDLLAHHQIYATGTTGKLLEKELNIKIIRLKSGPLGGDQQIGAKIVEGKIDFLIFFGDPQNHSLTTLMSKPCCEWPWFGISPSPTIAPSADFMISSLSWTNLTTDWYPDYDNYVSRKIDLGENQLIIKKRLALSWRVVLTIFQLNRPQLTWHKLHTKRSTPAGVFR
ncbi:MAG: methylglyoxal synthase [Anaerolineales bacterium]